MLVVLRGGEQKAIILWFRAIRIVIMLAIIAGRDIYDGLRQQKHKKTHIKVLATRVEPATYIWPRQEPITYGSSLRKKNSEKKTLEKGRGPPPH